MTFSIGVHAFRLPVRIGWRDAERETAQIVRFDLEIALPEAPAATVSDDLIQTIDYQGVCDVIRQTAGRGPYRLLERLAQVVRDELDQVLPDGAALTLTVTKERPPIPNLEGGASITLRSRHSS